MGVSYKELVVFLTIFAEKGGGGLGRVKKMRWSKKGEGGGLSFLTESKKNSFLMPAHHTDTFTQ